MAEEPGEADERLRGLEAQLAALDEAIGAGERLAGWKVGLTSGRARDTMGAGFRPFGHILASRVFPSGTSLELADLGRIGIENELCFTIRSTLGAEADAVAARAAVAAVAPAYEIIQRRVAGEGSTLARLADNLAQWGIVVGEEIDPGTVDYKSLVVTLSEADRPVETVAAADHIDDHFESLAALARQLEAFGRALEPGQRVITGSYTKQAVAGPSRWRGDFGAPLGTVEVRFT